MRYEDYLIHHGRPGQRWGVRNGPPYPLRLGGQSYGSIMKKKKKRPDPEARKKREADNERQLQKDLNDEKDKLSKARDASLDGSTKKKIDKRLKDIDDVLKNRPDLTKKYGADTKGQKWGQKPESQPKSKSAAERAKEFLSEQRAKSDAKKARRAEEKQQEITRKADEVKAAKEQERKDFLNTATAKQLRERQNEYTNDELEYAIQRIKKLQTLDNLSENDKNKATKLLKTVTSGAKTFNDFTKEGIAMYNTYANIYNAFFAKSEAEKKKTIGNKGNGGDKGKKKDEKN